MSEPERYAIAIVGGATAGAEAAAIFAAQGILTVVFEQNDRPYGKIEDGLPRWHVGLRRKEYDTIDDKLLRSRKLVTDRKSTLEVIAAVEGETVELPVKG